MATTKQAREPWFFRIRRVIKVVDGDTLDLEVDLGFRNYLEMRLRLLGIDTPEKVGATRPMGELATRELSRLVYSGPQLSLLSAGEFDKWGGRWDGEVRQRLPLAPASAGGTWIDAGTELLVNGYALPFDGSGPRPKWDPTKPYPLPPELRWTPELRA